MDSDRCIPQVLQAIPAPLGLPRFCKITDVIPDPRLRFHLYGIITTVIQDPVFCDIRKIIHIRDETCPLDGEFRVHVNFSMRSMKPRLEINRIVRLINVKVEPYRNYLDGRVFSGRDVTTFPELGNGTEGAESPSGNYKFSESDIKRITELRNWISQERLQPGFLDLQYRQLFPTISFPSTCFSADVAQQQDTSIAVASSSVMVEETQENVMKLVEDNEKKSQEEQKNTEDEEIKSLLLMHESYESHGIDLQEEAVCVQRGENVKPFPEFNNFDICRKDFSIENNNARRLYVVY